MLLSMSCFILCFSCVRYSNAALKSLWIVFYKLYLHPYAGLWRTTIPPPARWLRLSPASQACWPCFIFTFSTSTVLYVLNFCHRCTDTLQGKSHLYIPSLGIVQPQSQFHIHVSVSNLYIPRIGQHISLEQISQTNPGNMNLSQIYERRNCET